MLLFDQRTGNMTSSLRILLISTTVLSTAIMLKFSAPAITDFAASDVSSLWNGVVSWLKPPYLYLVINGIIITIVASSKLQSKSDDVSPSQHGTYVQVQPAAVFSTKQAYNNVVFDSAAVAEVAAPTQLPRTEVLSGYDYIKAEFDVFGHVDASISETDEAFTVKAAASPGPEAEEEMEMKRSNEFIISKSTWTPVSKNLPEYSPVSAQKPPPSARFSHRRKASIEGGKAALGVSKSKRQDTLESTWKTITEGRAMPLKRHLRKSDTWEMHGRRQHYNNPPEEEAAANAHKMTKSETFNDRRQTTSSMSPSPIGSGKLRKEPSLSQDELNKRVEAFIKKFNEDMRLQRQESLNQYMEMINRGAH